MDGGWRAGRGTGLADERSHGVARRVAAWRAGDAVVERTCRAWRPCDRLARRHSAGARRAMLRTRARPPPGEGRGSHQGCPGARRRHGRASLARGATSRRPRCARRSTSVARASARRCSSTSAGGARSPESLPKGRQTGACCSAAPASWRRTAACSPTASARSISSSDATERTCRCWRGTSAAAPRRSATGRGRRDAGPIRSARPRRCSGSLRPGLRRTRRRSAGR